MTRAPAASFDMELQRVVGLLEEQIDEMVDEILARVASEHPSWTSAAHPELQEPLRRVARESYRAEIAAFRDGRLPDQLAPVDAELAREAARMGASVSELSWSFRAGHAVQWHRWLDLVERHETEPRRRRDLLERGSAFFFAYADRMIQMVSDVYAEERERLLRNTEQRRFHLVRELLDGAEIDSASLGYDLQAWHIAMVIWGPAAGDALRTLTRRFASRSLPVGAIEDTYWVWIAHHRPPGNDEVKRIVRQLPSIGVHVAAGTAHYGPAGFRRSHREARDTHWVALSTTDLLTRYQDVALMVLTARDQDAARSFVETELCGLESNDGRTKRLRETLSAYLRCGLNAAATARTLGIHEQTVGNHLIAIEQRIGSTVAERHAELATALRLQALLH